MFEWPIVFVHRIQFVFHAKCDPYEITIKTLLFMIRYAKNTTFLTFNQIRGQICVITKKEKLKSVNKTFFLEKYTMVCAVSTKTKFVNFISFSLLHFVYFYLTFLCIKLQLCVIIFFGIGMALNLTWNNRFEFTKKWHVHSSLMLNDFCKKIYG